MRQKQNEIERSAREPWKDRSHAKAIRKILLAAANHDGNTNGLLRYWLLLIL
jgi:hypothetical protein